MQWNKIKLWFIIAFLILDVYLVFQLFPDDSIKGSELQSEEQEKLIDNLDGIDEVSAMEETIENKQYEAVKHAFTVDDLEEIPDNQNLETEIMDETMLIASLQQEPMQLPVSFPLEDTEESKEELDKFAAEHFLYGEDYTFWERQGNQLVFFQNTDDEPIFYSENGVLTLTLNNDYEVISYKQTYVEAFKVMEGQEDLEIDTATAREAVEKLQSDRTVLRAGDHIEVEVGYYPAIEVASTPIYTPAYHIEVTGSSSTEHYFYLQLPEVPYIIENTTADFLEEFTAQEQEEIQ